MPIGFFEDAEDLEPTNDVLDWQPDPCGLPVTGSLLAGERVMLGENGVVQHGFFAQTNTDHGK